MRVYHFMGEIWAKEALKKKRLKVSFINSLNDPFELHAGFSNSNDLLRNTFRAWKEEISKEVGILCFSKNWHNPLLWSHYAEKHTGCALGFEIPNDKAIEIVYTENRPLFKWTKMPSDPFVRQEFLAELHKTKFISWKYEEEFRLVYKLNTLDHEGQLYFQEFDKNLILREIITGCNSQMNEEELAAIINEYPKINVIKSQMDPKSYSIIKKESLNAAY